MFSQTYYDLISPDRLPPGSHFVDPYDKSLAVPSPGETLSDFISRIVRSRAQNSGAPELEPQAIERIVVNCLLETCKPKDIPLYFVEKHVPPTATQFFHLAKSLVVNALNPETISPKQQDTRASFCLNGPCHFHAGHSNWGTKVVGAIKKLAGIEDATKFPNYEKLGSCNLCGGCSLKVKVGFTLRSVLVSLTPYQIDDMFRYYGNKGFTQCWIFNEALKDPKGREILKKKIAHLDVNSPRIIAATRDILSADKKAAESAPRTSIKR